MVTRSNPFNSEIDVLNIGLRPFEYWQQRTLQVLNAWERGDRAAGISTGLASLDNFIRLVPEEVTVIAARPGMGKTSLALQIGTSTVPAGTKSRVAFFSAEMSGWSLYMRLACALAGVSMFSLRSRRADSVGFQIVREAIAALSNMPLLIDDASAPTIEYMDKELALMKEAWDVEVMIFDFMELGGDTGPNEPERIGTIMKGIKWLAKKHSIHAIAISQLNREVESRRDKMPQLSDIRQSGMIEQLADQVLLMVRPKYYLDRGIAIDTEAFSKLAIDGGGGASNIADVCYVPIAKVRNGMAGIARLGYDGPNMRFYDIQRLDLNKYSETVRQEEVILDEQQDDEA